MTISKYAYFFMVNSGLGTSAILISNLLLNKSDAITSIIVFESENLVKLSVKFQILYVYILVFVLNIIFIYYGRGD